MPKRRQILNIFATAIPALLIMASGVGKLLGPPSMVEALAKYGVAQHITILGIMEVAFAALFMVPATMKLGFLLSSCYFARPVGGG